MESLEDRQLLATQVFFQGTDLFIREGKSNESNAAILYDFGTGIAVVTERGFVANYFGMTSVTANLGGGNDYLAYIKLAPGTDALPGLTINADLGKGNDTFVANLLNSSVGTAGATNYTFNINGGDGNDTLIFNQNATANDGTLNASIGAGSTLSVNLLGGAGNDFINALVAGDNSGTLNMNIDGGSGNDTIVAFLNAMPDNDFTAGRFNIRITGGAGKDRINANAIEGGGAGSGNIDPASSFTILRGDNQDLIATNNSGLITVQ